MEAVKVRILSLQSNGQERETVRLHANGMMWEKDGICYLKYETEAASSEEVLRQQIEIWPGRTIVKTLGSPQSRMTFRTGERLQADYLTPYGEVPMEVLTHRLFVKRGEKIRSLELLLDYTLYVAGEYQADFQMKISARPERPSGND